MTKNSSWSSPFSIKNRVAIFLLSINLLYVLACPCAEWRRTEWRRENFLTFRPDLNLRKILYNLAFVSSIYEVESAKFCFETWPHLRSNCVTLLAHTPCSALTCFFWAAVYLLRFNANLLLEKRLEPKANDIVSGEEHSERHFQSFLLARIKLTCSMHTFRHETNEVKMSNWHWARITLTLWW